MVVIRETSVSLYLLEMTTSVRVAYTLPGGYRIWKYSTLMMFSGMVRTVYPATSTLPAQQPFMIYKEPAQCNN